MENGLVFVLELRGASNSSDQSTDDTHPSLNVILKWTFLFFFFCFFYTRYPRYQKMEITCFMQQLI